MRLVLALLLVAALAQAAPPYQVGQSAFEMLRAERLALTDRFLAVSTQLAVAMLDEKDTPPVDISELTPSATMSVRAGNWTYTVTLREREADSVPRGTFDVELLAGERSVGAVRLKQDPANPAAAEGARATFDIGGELPASALFVVTVHDVRVVVEQTLVSAINGTFEYVWRESSLSEEDNPTLTLAQSEELLLLVTNGDGTSPHNVQVLDGTDPTPTSPNVDNVGDETQLRWVPPGAGSYVYRCQYHPTMKGTIEVTP